MTLESSLFDLFRFPFFSSFFQHAFADGLECEESPVHILNGNDRLFDYICYLSLPRWKQDMLSDQRPELPGGN